MKAASGELNLTVVTVIAIGLVLAIFGTTILPMITHSMNKQWENVSTYHTS